MYNCLPEDVVSKIRDEVIAIKEKYQIVNPIIRTDIFNILDKICVVLRYPLDDEEANGIHVVRCIKGEPKHFVFINTSKGIEKQIYTAAHELGHVWGIDQKVLANISKRVDGEAIINRFAAELLMPYDIFLRFFALKCRDENIDAGPVEDKDLIKVIVYLMNTFMVPYKAVVYRLEEVGILDSVNRSKLEEGEEKYQDYILECKEAYDYQNILRTDKQKSMSELYHMLQCAEENELLSGKKIESIRKLFDYSKHQASYNDKEEIAIKNIPEE